MIAPGPSYEIVYDGKNITGDILPYVISFTYTDKTAGEADELELLLEDNSGLWSNEWYPVKGDSITARIFLLGKVLECGTFTIDELTGTGGSGGNTMSIKAIAAGINKKMRTRNSSAHENKTLREIVNTIATAHGLEVQGDIGNVRLTRATQYRETDLAFLHRLASEYGYEFSVRDNKLIFTNVYKIEDKAAALILKSNEIISWSITDKTSETYKVAKVAYHNPKEREVVSFEHKEDAATHDTAKSDTLEVRIRAENKGQAELKARAALYRTNSLQQTGSVELPGNLVALAGNNCELTGIGWFSGLFYIKSSTHTVSRDGGYTTSLDIKRVGVADKQKRKKND